MTYEAGCDHIIIMALPACTHAAFFWVSRYDDEGNKLEPIEEVTCEVGEEHAGAVIEALSARKGELAEMLPAPVRVIKWPLMFLHRTSIPL